VLLYWVRGFIINLIINQEPTKTSERSAQTRSEAKLSSVYILVEITEALPKKFLLKLCFFSFHLYTHSYLYAKIRTKLHTIRQKICHLWDCGFLLLTVGWVAKKGGGWWLRRGWVAKLEARLLATEYSVFESEHPPRKPTHSIVHQKIYKIISCWRKFQTVCF
jgi:hypothetical protein